MSGLTALLKGRLTSYQRFSMGMELKAISRRQTADGNESLTEFLSQIPSGEDHPQRRDLRQGLSFRR
jgi:hypothetical protein